MRTDQRGDAVSRAVLNFGAVILAAGASSRMGKPKLVLSWGKTSVLGHLIEQWQQAAAKQIAVVHAGADQAVGADLDRLDFPVANRIVNPQPERGMLSSIQCAAAWDRWSSGLTHWAIVLGDQPHLRRETLRELLEFAADHPLQVCQPSRRGRARHPVVLPKPVFERLKDSRVETLKQFLQDNGGVVALREMDDPGLDFDMDTPEDYEKARRLFAGEGGDLQVCEQ